MIWVHRVPICILLTLKGAKNQNLIRIIPRSAHLKILADLPKHPR